MAYYDSLTFNFSRVICNCIPNVRLRFYPSPTRSFSYSILLTRASLSGDWPDGCCRLRNLTFLWWRVSSRGFLTVCWLLNEPLTALDVRASYLYVLLSLVGGATTSTFRWKGNYFTLLLTLVPEVRNTCDSLGLLASSTCLLKLEIVWVGFNGCRLPYSGELPSVILTNSPFPTSLGCCEGTMPELRSDGCCGGGRV